MTEPTPVTPCEAPELAPAASAAGHRSAPASPGVGPHKAPASAASAAGHRSSPTSPGAGPRDEPPPAPRPAHLWGRRDALTAVAWVAVLGSLGAGSGAFLRLLFRRAPVEPPSVFTAGSPDDFEPGAISDRFLKTWRVFIAREGDALYAIHARCTHLGCTPRWHAPQEKFKCPCHGSGFTASGINVEGPAPRPLDRARVWIEGGKLWVDTSRRYTREFWNDPEVRARWTGRAPA